MLTWYPVETVEDGNTALDDNLMKGGYGGSENQAHRRTDDGEPIVR